MPHRNRLNFDHEIISRMNVLIWVVMIQRVIRESP